MSQEIIDAARERMDEAYSADLPNREKGLADLQFVVGKQWAEDVRAEREAEGKPCLTINGLPQYVRQVTAQIRNLNPGIQVLPADNPATEDIAEIYAGIIRAVENKHDATSIYEAAAESAAQCGIGHFRVRPDYCTHDSFEQELLIERIPNPFAVFWDPLAKDPTRKDARYCFIAEEIHKDDFAKQYPDKTLTDITSDHRPAGVEQWVRGEHVTIAEYFWVEHEEYTLVNIDGQAFDKRELPPGFPKVHPMTGKPWPTRKTRRPYVMWAKISFDEVLEGPTEMPCSHIPVFAVTGEEIHIGEEVYRSSVVRHAKDPQVLYNYARSTQAEVISIQPRAPYLVTAKQIAGLDDIWAQANNANRPYLVYNPDEKAPAPMRVPPPIASQALTQEIQLAAEDMKRTTGIYDAALGARSNETSGVAINARKLEAANSTSVYADNMVKAVAQCGRVMAEMIPRVYDTERVIRILGADDQEKAVTINQVFRAPDGSDVVANDVTTGRYDVRVSVGPAYQTLKQEAAAGQLEFLRTLPQAAPVIADIVAGNQEWPEADRIAERLRKMLPPGMEEDDQVSPEQQQMAQQQAMQQAQQEQQQQQMMQQAAQLEFRKADAEARKAEANAQKAEAEAIEAEIKVRLMQAGMTQGVM